MAEVNKIEGTTEHHDMTMEDEKERAAHDTDASSINSLALGDDLPQGYFYSVNFIGAMIVSCHSSMIFITPAERLTLD